MTEVSKNARLLVLLAFSAVALFSISACGSDDDDDNGNGNGSGSSIPDASQNELIESVSPGHKSTGVQMNTDFSITVTEAYLSDAELDNIIIEVLGFPADEDCVISWEGSLCDGESPDGMTWLPGDPDRETADYESFNSGHFLEPVVDEESRTITFSIDGYDLSPDMNYLVHIFNDVDRVFYSDTEGDDGDEFKSWWIFTTGSDF